MSFLHNLAVLRQLRNPFTDFRLRVKRDMQPSDYRLVRLWFKETNGTLFGTLKKYFFSFAVLNGPPGRGCSGGIRSIRGPQVSLGSLRVGARHAQSPTPYTLALGSYLPVPSAVQLTQA